MKPVQCSVLVIDDEPVDRYIIRRMLDKAAVHGDLIEKTDGQQALDFLISGDENNPVHEGSFPPDAIFLDINMPIMNGFEFLEAFDALSDDENEHHSKVFVMINTFASAEDHEKAASYNCVSGCIDKESMTSAFLNRLLDSRFSNSAHRQAATLAPAFA